MAWLFRQRSPDRHDTQPVDLIVANGYPDGPEIAEFPGDVAMRLLQNSEQTHQEFAAEAASRGVNIADIPSAAADAINAGVLGRFFRGLSWRDARRPIACIILHGEVPPDALSAQRYGETVVLRPVNPTRLPTINDVRDPETDFYTETRLIPSPSPYAEEVDHTELETTAAIMIALAEQPARDDGEH